MARESRHVSSVPDWMMKNQASKFESDPGEFAPTAGNSEGSNVLYLLGATTQVEVQGYVRANCAEAQVRRLPEIMSSWRNAAQLFAQLARTDRDTVEDTEVSELAEAVRGRLEEISADSLFQGSFSRLPIEFKLVPIDNLIACQRTINLDHVRVLQSKLDVIDDPSELVEFCLAPRYDVETPASLQYAANGMVYSSRNRDLRFLGGYAKEVDESDIAAAHGGGVPAGAVVLLLGYGIRCINVYSCGKRLILNNGFHRAFALRAAGISHVPAVVQRVQNPDLEFPTEILGLPKQYLLNYPRPALVKDFFDEGLVTRFEIKPRQRTLKIAWAVEQFDVPLARNSALDIGSKDRASDEGDLTVPGLIEQQTS